MCIHLPSLPVWKAQTHTPSSPSSSPPSSPGRTRRREERAPPGFLREGTHSAQTPFSRPAGHRSPGPRCGSSPPLPWAGPPQRGPVSPRRARSPRLPRGRCLSRLPGEAAPAPGAARTHRPSPWPWRRPGLPRWLPDGGGARRAGGGGPGRRRQRGGGALTRTAPPRRGEGGREGGAGRGGGIPRGCGKEQRCRPRGSTGRTGAAGGERARRHVAARSRISRVCAQHGRDSVGFLQKKPAWESRQLRLTFQNFVPSLFTGPQDRIGLLVACIKWIGQLHPHLDGHCQRAALGQN